MRRLLIWTGTIILLAAPGASAEFHDGGVGSCQGCHLMHDSQDGASVNPGGVAGLLRFDTTTDVCLSCHADRPPVVLGSNVLNPPAERGAGSFTFLLEENINDASNGALNWISGDHAGHNLTSAMWGLLPDPDIPVAPGGTFPSDRLECVSCHDPHGNGNYRMLRGAGPINDEGHVFLSPAPSAAGIDLAGGPEGPANHTAYLDGWSDWCANCHGLYHDQVPAAFEHPVREALGSVHVGGYNSYQGTADPNGGVYATAYLPEVPLEDLSFTTGGTEGATTASRISCMTCHRAHGTSALRGTRWDTTVRYLDQDGFSSGSHPIPSPYPGLNEFSLCRKCHYADRRNHGAGRACMACHGGGGTRTLIPEIGLK